MSAPARVLYKLENMCGFVNRNPKIKEVGLWKWLPAGSVGGRTEWDRSRAAGDSPSGGAITGRISHELIHAVEHVVEAVIRLEEDAPHFQLARAVDVRALRVGGEEDHGQGGPSEVGADHLQELDAAHLRHHRVEDDYVGRGGRDRHERLAAVARRPDRVPGAAEEAADDVPAVRVVIDDQNRTHLILTSE